MNSNSGISSIAVGAVGDRYGCLSKLREKVALSDGEGVGGGLSGERHIASCWREEESIAVHVAMTAEDSHGIEVVGLGNWDGETVEGRFEPINVSMHEVASQSARGHREREVVEDLLLVNCKYLQRGQMRLLLLILPNSTTKRH